MAACFCVVALVLWVAQMPAMLLGALFAAGCIAVALLTRRLSSPLRNIRAALESTVSVSGPPAGAWFDEYLIGRSLFYLGLLAVTATSLRFAGFTYSDWIFLVASLAACAELFVRREVPVILPVGFIVGALLLSLGSTISSLASRREAESLAEVGKYFLLLFVWFWTGSMVLRRQQQVVVAMGCWVASAAACAAASVLQVFGYGAVGGAALKLAVGGILFGRATGLAQHMNELGTNCALAFIPGIALTAMCRSLVLRALSVAAVGLMLAGLLLSVSFSAFVALLAGAVAWTVCVDNPRSLLKARRIVALVLVLSLSTYILHVQDVRSMQRLTDRLVRIDAQRESSDTVGYRLASYRAAIEYIKNSPLIGQGLDPSDTLTEAGLQVHNIVLLHWYEGGVLAAIGISLILFTIGYLDYAMILEATDVREWYIGIALLLTFVVFLVDAMVSPVGRHRDTWVFGLLTVAIAARNRAANGVDQRLLSRSM